MAVKSKAVGTRVPGYRHHRRNDAPEQYGCCDAKDKGSQGASQTLSFADSWCVASPHSSKGRGGGVAPGEQDDGHDGYIFGAKVHDGPGPSQVGDYTIVFIVGFGFAHQCAEEADVEAIERAGDGLSDILRRKT